MIPNFKELAKGYEDVSTEQTTEREQIEAGVYPCQIMGVTLKETTSGKQYIECMLEITDGKYKGFFTRDYRAQKDDGYKKWRACHNLFVPSTSDEQWKIDTFLKELKCVDKSNGTTFDGNEASLKGKKVACAFRREEYSYNDKNGWTVRPFKFVTLEDYKNGKLPKIEDKPLKSKGYTASSQPQPQRNLPIDINVKIAEAAQDANVDFEVISDNELPF